MRPNRFLLALAWLALCAAAPVPVRLEPPAPVLGVPLTMTIEVPDAETQLAGLPDLGPFALLAPPRREGTRLELTLLPMRPGRQTLPSLSLHQGRFRQVFTRPVAVTIEEDLDEGAGLAELKQLPRPETGASPWWLAVILGPGSLLALAIWRKQRPPQPVSAETSSEAELLEDLKRQIEERDCRGDERWRELSRRVQEARFSPTPAEAELVNRLLDEYRRLLEEAT